MVPGQPVQHHLVPAGRLADGLLALCGIGHQVVEGDRHHLGQAGGAGGQHQGRAVVRLQPRDGPGHRRCRHGGQHLSEGRGRLGQPRRIGGDDPGRAQVEGLQGRRGRGGVLGEHHGRLHLGDHVGQAPKVPAQSGIGGAHRAGGAAGGLGGEAHHREGRGVARQDQHRPGSRHIQQPLGRRVHVALQLGEGGEPPFAVRAPLGQGRLVAGGFGPPGERRRDVGVIGAQRDLGRDQDHAVGAALDVQVHRQQVGFAEWRGRGLGEGGVGHAQTPTTRLTVVVVEPPMFRVWQVLAPSTW